MLSNIKEKSLQALLDRVTQFHQECLDNNMEMTFYFWKSIATIKIEKNNKILEIDLNKKGNI